MFRGKHRCFPSDEATDPCVHQPQAQQQGLTSAGRRAQKVAAGLNRTFHPPILLLAKQSGSVKKGSCPHKTCVRQLLPCTNLVLTICEALADVFHFGQSLSQAIHRCSPGLEGRLQMWRFAAASAGLAADTPRLQGHVCCWSAAY